MRSGWYPVKEVGERGIQEQEEVLMAGVSVPGWAMVKPRILEVLLRTAGKGGEQTVGV